jgi:tetratricopeptide (TPR) repeat protein
MELTIEQALHQGIAAHQDGKLQEAERLYRAILQSQPQHPDANHNLGVLAVSVNKAEAALSLFKAALEANPKVEQFWLSYIDTLIKGTQYEKAKQAIEESKKRGVISERLSVLELQISKNSNPSKAKLDRLLEYYQTGLYDDAEKLAVSLTKEFPKHHFGWKVLGALFKQKGKNSEAINISQKAVEISPLDAEAYNNLAASLQELGELKKAEAKYRQAIVLKSDFTQAYSNLGVTLQELDRLAEAETASGKAIILKPDLAEAHNNLGNTFQKQDKLEGSNSSLRQAILLKPNYTQAYCNLGVTLQKLGRLGEAKSSFRKALILKSDFAEALNNYGAMLQELGQLEEAEACLRKAITMKSNYALAYYNLGATLQKLGGLEEAEALYQRAIRLKPRYAEAHRLLASTKKFSIRDERFSKMLELYLDKSILGEQRCHISFGLAKASEDIGNFRQAFKYYNEGNLLRKKRLNYDIKTDIELFTQLKANYPRIKNNLIEANRLANTLTPIFILGMPRSGTSLVEQIISSHSQVTGAGELSFASKFGSSLARGLSEVNTDALLNFRDKYIKNLKNYSNKNLFVTDKMPQNFRYTGLLAAAFPEAKIVHVKRNPAAVCWGNYKQYFSSKTLGYCYSLDDIVEYYGLYKDLMEFWSSQFPSRVCDVDYEVLTVNQEDETKKLINYLGLKWEEECLSPQDNKRSVATASNIQVRQRVYKGSSQQWQNFKPFLDGAFDELLPS